MASERLSGWVLQLRVAMPLEVPWVHYIPSLNSAPGSCTISLWFPCTHASVKTPLYINSNYPYLTEPSCFHIFQLWLFAFLCPLFSLGSSYAYISLNFVLFCCSRGKSNNFLLLNNNNIAKNCGKSIRIDSFNKPQKKNLKIYEGDLLYKRKQGYKYILVSLYSRLLP